MFPFEPGSELGYSTLIYNKNKSNLFNNEAGDWII